MAVCKSCGASIFWALTPEGRSIPIDQKPVDGGNIVLDENHVATVISTTDREATRSRATYQSHFVSCPNADQHRRSR